MGTRRLFGWQQRYPPTLADVSPRLNRDESSSIESTGENIKFARKRAEIEIARGRGVCRLCGQPIRSGDKWSLSREAGGTIHSRCGFQEGLLGKRASSSAE